MKNKPFDESYHFCSVWHSVKRTYLEYVTVATTGCNIFGKHFSRARNLEPIETCLVVSVATT